MSEFTPGHMGPLSRGLLIFAASCFLAGTGVTVLDVLCRAIASWNLPAAIELTTLFIGLGALASMPVCYGRRAHVTARLLSEFLPGRVGRLMNIFGALLSLVFAAAMAALMTKYAFEKFGGVEVTPDTGLSVSLLISITAITLLAALAASFNGLRAAFAGERADG